MRSVGINGIRAGILGETLLVRSRRPLKVLSSAVLNGGWTTANSIINHQVPKDFSCRDPEGYLRRVATRKLKLGQSVVGLMTAANVRNFVFKRERSRQLTIATLITAGLSFPATAGDKPSTLRAEGGTINIILLIDANPTESCMVNIVKTATEAQVVALRNLDIRSRFSRDICTGTTSDAIVVASTGQGRPIEYAGTASTPGYLVAQAVISGIEEAVAKGDRIVRRRSLLQRLQERGILLDDLVNTGIELFIQSSGMSVRQASALLRAELERVLGDVNIQALVLAALRLEEDGNRGLIPGLSPEDYRCDPITLVADESIGLAIANYLAGTWGIYNFLRYDRMKPGMMSKIGPFMDDAVGAVVAGALTRIMTSK